MKNILIGITGSIAAYKICELIRMFKKDNCNVKVVLTPNAKEFVTVLTLETLSQNPVYTEQFTPRDSVEHISLCDWADYFILAPLDANTLSKIAGGICDNLLTSVVCAYLGRKKPLILAPAMNTGMWQNPIVQKNLQLLKELGCTILEPEDGPLACGYNDKGRLCSLDKIYNSINNNLPLKDKTVIITAGGTKEKIDPVRYISNSSSGKMGLALAKCAHNLGAKVELICTFETKQPYKVTYVQSADEMLDAVQKSFIDDKAHRLIMAAAVGDFKVKNYSEEKISKKNNQAPVLELVQNPDILKTICEKKSKEQMVIGFCLSTQNVIENAKEKIKNKGCDYIIANEAKTALGTDKNEIWIIDKSLNVQKIEKNTKENIACAILEKLYD